MGLNNSFYCLSNIDFIQTSFLITRTEFLGFSTGNSPCSSDQI